jgi:hypothetical protein
LSDERVGVAATTTTQFLLRQLIRVVVLALFDDEVNGSTDRQILGKILST